MSAAPDRNARSGVLAWLAIVAIAAAWPIANFLHNNWSQLLPSDLTRALFWWCVVFGPAAAAVLLAGRWFPRIALARFALAAAFGLILFFLFGWGMPRIAALANLVGVPRQVASPVYLLLAAGITLGVLRFSRSVQMQRIMATFIVVAGATSGASLLGDVFRTGLQDASNYVAQPLVPPGKQPQTRPNVFMVVLDGYSRHDVLSRVAGFDNGPFIRSLRDRGFVVLEHSVANYPTTYLSVSSLLAADYLAVPEGPAFTTRSHFYDVIQGNNPIVASFRSMGYRYVHSGNSWGGSACSGREDFCLNSIENVPTREIDLSLVKMTPFRLALPSLVTTTERGNLPFILSGLDQLYRQAPFLFFGHTMPPHPPFDLSPECRKRKRLPSLEWWSSPGEYRDSTLCVNKQLTTLVDRVSERDPDSIQAIFSDHGSGFTKPFEKPLDQWSDDMIAERLPSFVAIRVPAHCRQALPDDLSNVNLGRFIVACVSGTPPDYRPNRFFTAASERHPSFGRVHEVTSRVHALKLRGGAGAERPIPALPRAPDGSGKRADSR